MKHKINSENLTGKKETGRYITVVHNPDGTVTKVEENGYIYEDDIDQEERAYTYWWMGRDE